MSDLIERLRHGVCIERRDDGWETWTTRNPDGLEAADTITKLLAKVELLERALRALMEFHESGGHIGDADEVVANAKAALREE